jgi:hypothetical protein
MDINSEQIFELMIHEKRSRNPILTIKFYQKFKRGSKIESEIFSEKCFYKLMPIKNTPQNHQEHNSY